MRYVFALFLACSAGSLWAARPPFAGQLQQGGTPQLTFTDNTIEASGLGPNASVTVAGFVIETHNYTRTITTPAYSQRSDAKGNLVVTVPGGVQPRSVWILVTHAGYTVASPMGVLRTFDVPTANLAFDPSNQLSSVIIPRAHTEVFAIPRPSDGPPDPVITADAKDGSPADADNEMNGTITVSIQAKQGATLFVVDTLSLECSVVAVSR